MTPSRTPTHTPFNVSAVCPPAVVPAANAALTTEPHWNIHESRFGQLCNSVQQVVSFQDLFASMAREGVEPPVPRGIALGGMFSSYVLKANLSVMTLGNFSLYVGCRFADPQSSWEKPQPGMCPFMTCQTRFLDGRQVPHDPKRLVFVPVIQTPNEMWLKHRPALVGFSPFLARQQPRLDLVRIAETAVERLRAIQASSGAGVIVGLHRRGLDGRCYRWLQRGGEGTPSCVSGELCYAIYECHPSSPIGYHGGILVNLTKSAPQFRKGQVCGSASDWGDDSQMSLRDEKCYTDLSPYYSICDFTFSEFDVAYLKREWPAFAHVDTKRMLVLLASDMQRPNGDVRLAGNLPWNLTSSSTTTTTTTAAAAAAAMAHQRLSRVFTLKGLVPEAKIEDNYALMFAEMWALSLVDLYVPNALSSCDTVVAHWRRHLGRAKGELFPPVCWNGYWDEDAPSP